MTTETNVISIVWSLNKAHVLKAHTVLSFIARQEELTSEHSHEVWTTGSQDVPMAREFCVSHNQRNVAQKPHLALLVETL